jgi:tetratricopeptide (TPR) repeat protein
MLNSPEHVFISHSSKDLDIANLICEILEEHQIRCWIAPRDIPPGTEYADEIIKAIRNSLAFVIIITKNSDNSRNVRNEIEIAVNCDTHKFGIILDNHEMSGYLQYHFSRIQLIMTHTPVTIDKIHGLINALQGSVATTGHPQTNEGEKSCKHNLPAPLPMIGREADLDEIVTSLGNETQHYMVLGMTGIGKKTLANNIAHKILKKNFYDVIIWLTAQDGSLTFDIFLEHMALVFDDQYLNRLETEEREKAAFNLLQQKAVLFIINGLHEIFDEKVLQFINRFTYDDAVIITSDVNPYFFDNYKTTTLRGLSKKEVHQLVELEGKRIGLPNLGKVPENIINDLHRLTSGNPYVIKLSIGQIKAGIPFERVLLGLEQARGKVFDDVFAKSWSIIDENQKDLLMCLSLFRSPASSLALQSISENSDWDFAEDISNLINLSLVETNGAFLTEDIRYSILPLTRSYAKNKLNETLSGSKFYLNFVNYFSEYVATFLKDFQALTIEIENLRFMIAWLKENDTKRHLHVIRQLYPFLRDIGHWDEAIKNFSFAIEANKDNSDMEPEISYARCELVSIYIRRGGTEELDISDLLLDQALEVFTELEDHKGLCAALGRKARVAQKKKDYIKALEFGKQALDIAKQHQINSRIADISHEIGDSYFYLGDYKSAKEQYTNSLRGYQEFNNEIRTIGRYNDLGRLAMRMGDYAEARQLLNQSILLAEEHKKMDTLCRAYINMADTLHYLDEFSLAQEYANKGKELAIKLRAYQEIEFAEEISNKISSAVI